jgi:hypothetical protein
MVSLVVTVNASVFGAAHIPYQLNFKLQLSKQPLEAIWVLRLTGILAHKEVFLHSTKSLSCPPSTMITDVNR